MMLNLLVGVDPGVNTGLAVWDRALRQFISVATTTYVQAQETILALHKGAGVEVWFEDAGLRTWFGNKGREALQGAGSIKRECSLWREWLDHHGIPFKALKPAAGATKWDADRFKAVTKWEGRTSSHARDAANLVFGA